MNKWKASKYLQRKKKLDELETMMFHGSLTAAVYLKELYAGGRWMHFDGNKEYRYACYAAKLGDLDSALELYRRDLPVKGAFVEDVRKYAHAIDAEDLDLYEAVEYPDRVRIYGMRKRIWGDAAPERNEGYLDPDMFESSVEVYGGCRNPYDVVKDISPEAARGLERRWVGQSQLGWPMDTGIEGWYARGCTGDFADFVRSGADVEFLRLLFAYAGYGTERDEELALRGFLDHAEHGDEVS